MGNKILKRLHDIHTYHFFEGDLNLCGKDEEGNEFELSMSAYELLEWINTNEVREELAKWILKNKN